MKNLVRFGPQIVQPSSYCLEDNAGNARWTGRLSTI